MTATIARVSRIAMSLPASRLMTCPMRTYSNAARDMRGDRLGAIAAFGYICAVVSAPFAGAFVVSQKARKDQRYATMRPLSFRDCLPGSPLEDYAGAFRSRR